MMIVTFRYKHRFSSLIEFFLAVAPVEVLSDSVFISGREGIGILDFFLPR